jgi:protein NEDD1
MPSHGTSIAASPPTAGLSDYQVSLLRSMLDESLYSLRSEMRSQITDLQMDMVRQFHMQQQQQQQQMQAMQDAFRAMVEEVKELREDYKQLRHLH